MLCTKQFQELHHISFTDKENAILSLRGDELCTKEGAEKLIAAYAPLIKALEPAAAVTYFTGWFRCVGLAQQYAMSKWNKRLDIPLDGITVELCPNEEEGYGFTFVLHDFQLSDVPTTDRDAWRDDILRTFYEQTARPLLETLADTVELDRGQIWTLLATGYTYYVDTWLADVQPEEKQRIESDFEYLKKSVEPAVFGRKKNPFNIEYRMVDNWKKNAPPLRMKAACCLYYRTDGGTYCYTCPRMNEEQRAVRGAELVAQYS